MPRQRPTLVPVAFLLAICLSPSLFAQQQVCRGYLAVFSDWANGRYLGNPAILMNPPEPIGGGTQDDFVLRDYREEYAVVGRGDNPELNDLIDELALHNGQLRLVHSSSLQPAGTEAYFRITTLGNPIIAVERTSAFAVVAHEGVHFRGWLDRRRAFLALGLSPTDAGWAALDERTSESVEAEETSAVAEELRHLRWSVFHPHYISRSVYPPLRALRHCYTAGNKKDEALLPFAHRALQKTLAVLSEREALSRAGDAPWRYRRLNQRDCSFSNLAKLMGVTPNMMLTYSLLQRAYEQEYEKCEAMVTTARRD